MVMAKKQPFAPVYADEVKQHVRTIEGRTGRFAADQTTASGFSTRSIWRAMRFGSWRSASKSGTVSTSEERSLRNEDYLCRRYQGAIECLPERESEKGPVVVTRNGKAVAVLLSVTDDDELERLLLAHSPKFQAILDKSRRQIDETGGIPHEQFWRGVAAETRKPAVKNGSGSRRTRR